MKTEFSPVRRGWGTPLWVAAILGVFTFQALAELPRPIITAVKATRTNLLVTVSVPVGVKQVVLEGRARFAKGSWEPRAVTQTDGTGGDVVVAVDFARELEILRVKADSKLPLPASFYTSTTDFKGQEFDGATATPGTYTTFDGSTTGMRDGSSAEGGESRDVVESDIWRVRGDTLYFFNQNRGLQVIDIANPDQAFLRGTYPLPASGEQMYVTGDYVVLLARDGCYSYTGGSRIIVVNSAGLEPVEAASLPVAGRILESRMVGSALYVSSAVYRPVTGSADGAWEFGTMISSFDLADPAQPASRGTLWYGGYSDDVAAATDTFFFVATRVPTNYYLSELHIIDITAPDGTMREHATLQPKGRINDKFKINYAGGILTTIAEDWRRTTANRVTTWLETYRLPDPRSMGPLGIAKLGELELGRGEQLHATRFDGNRVYVVTFFRIDPLWVVDLSDPAKPAIVGELEVPGWSTYIQPLGDRLVAVGVETNRVAVSLFDVRDPARPQLFNKVLLGESYSWSEANNDEKAFTVLPDQQLILVPYSGNTTNGWATRVQIIDLNDNNLVRRGIIEHACQPRRATVANNRILSISGWELITVDATDRDEPEVRQVLDLAWSVDRVVVAGDYLLEFVGTTRYGLATPEVRVAPANDPDQTLAKLELDNVPLAGTELKGDRLYLAQSAYEYATDGGKMRFLLTVIDVSGLPNLAIVSKTETNLSFSGWAQSWEAVWPQANLLVWVNAQSGGYYYYPYYPIDIAIRPGMGFMGDGMFAAWPWYGSGGQMLAYDVTDPVAPKLTSLLDLSTNGWYSFSKPYVSGGLVYLSHMAPLAIDDPLPPNPEDPVYYPTYIPYGRWMQKYFLDVVDFADPSEPLVRKPVNIPGTLKGISHAGNVIYTVGNHYNESSRTDGVQWLDASAYDGIAAHLIQSLALGTYYNPLAMVIDGRLLTGEVKYGDTQNPTTTELTKWILDDDGNFQPLAKTSLPGYMYDSRLLKGMLAVRNDQSEIRMLDVTSDNAFSTVGRESLPCYAWPNLAASDGDRQRGLWVPLSSYGVKFVPILSAP